MNFDFYSNIKSVVVKNVNKVVLLSNIFKV